jgi:hypothetical protein
VVKHARLWPTTEANGWWMGQAHELHMCNLEQWGPHTIYTETGSSIPLTSQATINVEPVYSLQFGTARMESGNGAWKP